MSMYRARVRVGARVKIRDRVSAAQINIYRMHSTIYRKGNSIHKHRMHLTSNSGEN